MRAQMYVYSIQCSDKIRFCTITYMKPKNSEQFVWLETQQALSDCETHELWNADVNHAHRIPSIKIFCVWLETQQALSDCETHELWNADVNHAHRILSIKILD